MGSVLDTLHCGEGVGRGKWKKGKRKEENNKK